MRTRTAIMMLGVGWTLGVTFIAAGPPACPDQLQCGPLITLAADLTDVGVDSSIQANWNVGNLGCALGGSGGTTIWEPNTCSANIKADVSGQTGGTSLRLGAGCRPPGSFAGGGGADELFVAVSCNEGAFVTLNSGNTSIVCDNVTLDWTPVVLSPVPALTRWGAGLLVTMSLVALAWMLRRRLLG